MARVIYTGPLNPVIFARAKKEAEKAERINGYKPRVIKTPTHTVVYNKTGPEVKAVISSRHYTVFGHDRSIHYTTENINSGLHEKVCNRLAQKITELGTGYRSRHVFNMLIAFIGATVSTDDPQNYINGSMAATGMSIADGGDVFIEFSWGEKDGEVSTSESNSTEAIPPDFEYSDSTSKTKSQYDVLIKSGSIRMLDLFNSHGAGESVSGDVRISRRFNSDSYSFNSYRRTSIQDDYWLYRVWTNSEESASSNDSELLSKSIWVKKSLSTESESNTFGGYQIQGSGSSIVKSLFDFEVSDIFNGTENNYPSTPTTGAFFSRSPFTGEIAGKSGTSSSLDLEPFPSIDSDGVLVSNGSAEFNYESSCDFGYGMILESPIKLGCVLKSGVVTVSGSFNNGWIYSTESNVTWAYIPISSFDASVYVQSSAPYLVILDGYGRPGYAVCKGEFGCGYLTHMALNTNNDSDRQKFLIAIVELLSINDYAGFNSIPSDVFNKEMSEKIISNGVYESEDGLITITLKRSIEILKDYTSPLVFNSMNGVAFIDEFVIRSVQYWLMDCVQAILDYARINASIESVSDYFDGVRRLKSMRSVDIMSLNAMGVFDDDLTDDEIDIEQSLWGSSSHDRTEFIGKINSILSAMRGYASQKQKFFYVI